MLFALFGLGVPELIALVLCFGVLPGTAALIGALVWFTTKKSNANRGEIDRDDDDDDETAIQVRNP